MRLPKTAIWHNAHSNTTCTCHAAACIGIGLGPGSSVVTVPRYNTMMRATHWGLEHARSWRVAWFAGMCSISLRVVCGHGLSSTVEHPLRQAKQLRRSLAKLDNPVAHVKHPRPRKGHTCAARREDGQVALKHGIKQIYVHYCLFTFYFCKTRYSTCEAVF